jgi:D-3-phosphoglycerate dehydrogenase
MIPELDRFYPVFDHFGLEVFVPEVNERLEEKEILIHAGRFDGTICGDDRFTRQVLEACAPRLRVISKWGTGIDSIDKETAKKIGIKICNTPNAFTLPVADSVMGYILAFARRQPWMDRDMKAGSWEKKLGRSLSECTLGVIGVGNCGKATLRRARSFGMELLGNDIIEIAPDFISEYGVRMTSLEHLLSHADFVSLNATLNPTSHHIINRKTLRLMKTESVLINTARGPLVDEQALIEALQSGGIAGAALDVFEVEPLPLDSPLLRMDNVMLAPHNANSSPVSWERVHWNSIRDLLKGLGMSAEELKNFQ